MPLSQSERDAKRTSTQFRIERDLLSKIMEWVSKYGKHTNAKEEIDRTLRERFFKVKK